MDVNIGGHISCKYLILTIWEFDQMEKKHILYHENDCLKKFCESLRIRLKNIIDFENKKVLLLTKEEQKFTKVGKDENEKVVAILIK